MWAAYNSYGECVADAPTQEELETELYLMGIDLDHVDCFEVWG